MLVISVVVNTERQDEYVYYYVVIWLSKLFLCAHLHTCSLITFQDIFLIPWNTFLEISCVPYSAFFDFQYYIHEKTNLAVHRFWYSNTLFVNTSLVCSKVFYDCSAQNSAYLMHISLHSSETFFFLWHYMKMNRTEERKGKYLRPGKLSSQPFSHVRNL